MKLSLREIGDKGRVIELRESVDALGELLAVTEGEVSALDRGLDIDLRAEMVQNTVLVRGRVMTSVSQPCVRCLHRLKTEVDAPVDAAFFPVPDKHDPDQELHKDDLDVLYYEGLEIDLSDLVREAILLELSTYPTCGETEAECVNRAEIDSVMAQEESFEEEDDKGVDPRWAALAAIKAKMDKPN